MSFFKLTCACLLVTAAAAIFTIAFGYEQAAKSGMELCKHQYALCTSALCIPQPDDPTKAICFCAVEEGASMSSVPCNTTQPSIDANGIRTVYSAFSLEQFKQGKKVLQCPNGTPWTWCLNNVAQSIHLIPRRRSVSATCCELKNGLRWAAIATPPLAKQDTGPAQR
jgi:hypothetical protein